MSIFIGGAWAYANGSLHVGHVSSLLPGDIIARYYRLKGEDVLYVSGSDCNGTPIAVKAKQEGVSPKDITDYYHNEFKNCYDALGFSYDIYTRTDTKHHHKGVQAIFLTLLENGYIYKKEVEQLYCGECEQFLPDRYVEGNCPVCHAPSRGDQCDHCSAVLESTELENKTCKLCKSEPISKKTEHFYLALSSFQKEIKAHLEHAKKNGLWRENALLFTNRYLTEGLKDRAISRDLPLGVSVPVKGYEEKKIYVWIEAVAGYYTASEQWGKENDQQIEPFWNEKTISYYIHGKDNIPFHAIIWPAVLKGIKKNSLPTHILSNEYVTLEKKKLSTSRNWAVWVPDILERYDPDSIRYFLTINAPESRDADFSWKEFIHSHNNELLGAYGNLVNRTLKFVEKSFESKLPEKKITKTIEERVSHVYQEVGEKIEKGLCKGALERIFELVRFSNKYFDEKQPWKNLHDDKEVCEQTLADCVYLIANIAHLLTPFLPFSSEKVKGMLGINPLRWQSFFVDSTSISNVIPLFERIDAAKIEEERQALAGQVTQ